MNLVWVFLGIALAGVVGLVFWGIWLWHKASDVFSELSMLGKRADEAADLFAQLKLPS